ncbi:uncharacterized protein [Haliotis asinina]|uniref:uncharacterized protein n=1 Tax=Haliotis asinina TaxID=109174 RepID=UPI0035326518
MVDCDIEYITSSPYNSRANGKAESAVKAAKRLLRKANDSGNDQYLAVLDYRNTPTQGVGSSPAQRLMNRRCKTLLPTSANPLKPRTTGCANERQKVLAQQKKQNSNYDRHAKDLEPLGGDVVKMKPFSVSSKVWQKGVISKRLDERSYDVETGRGVVRRNRQHVRKTPERTPDRQATGFFKPPSETDSAVNAAVSQPTPTPVSAQTPVPATPKLSKTEQAPSTPCTMTTRSGRTLRAPKKFNDFTT